MHIETNPSKYNKDLSAVPNYERNGESFSGHLTTIGGGVFALVGLCVFLSAIASPSNDWGTRHRVAALTEAERKDELAYETMVKKLVLGGEHYSPLRMIGDYPGVANPTLSDADQAEVEGSTEVVGVSVDGEACAFMLAEMDGPRTHIANLMLSNTPVSVSYCDKSDCVRVLTENADELIPLNVAGLDIHDRMVLELRGAWYGHSSEAMPLMDLSFERTSWAEWKSDHPSTKIWLPEQSG